jgi:hypothetical protein
LECRIFLRDAARQRCVLITNQLVSAEQRFEARHFGGDRRERESREIGIVGDQRDVRMSLPGAHTAVGVSHLGLAEHFWRACGAHASNLIL